MAFKFLGKIMISQILLIFLATNSVYLVTSFEYGEDCDPTSNATVCDEKLFLQCFNVTGTYTCRCPDDMTLGSDFKTCVSKIGSRCDIENEVPMRNCTANAICELPADGTNPLCRCNANYLPLPGNITCRMGYGGSCIRPEDCHTNSLLSCQNNICLCEKPNSQIWDENSSRCLGLVGGTCNNDDDAFIKKPCVENANCTNRHCECADGYKETTEKQCKLAYEQNCTNTAECHPNYVCTNSSETEEQTICQCNTESSVYNDQYGTCDILAGKTCIPGESSCVEHASCSERTRTCQCGIDFKQSQDGYCFGGYRSDCKQANDRCDTANYLECHNDTKICECMANYIYSISAQKCVGFAGANCTDNSNCHETTICNANTSLCQCRPDYTQTPENTCLLGYEKYCTGPSTPCNTYQFLHCDIATKSCLCENPTAMVYNTTRAKCLALAGKYCHAVNEPGAGERVLECVPNANCTRISGSTDPIDGNCICFDGYTNENGNCVRVTTGSGIRNTLVDNWITALLLALSLTVYWKSY